MDLLAHLIGIRQQLGPQIYQFLQDLLLLLLPLDQLHGPFCDQGHQLLIRVSHIIEVRGLEEMKELLGFQLILLVSSLPLEWHATSCPSSLPKACPEDFRPNSGSRNKSHIQTI